jgi:hypothetical protein
LDAPVILWVGAEQREALALAEGKTTAALVSPATGGFVSVVCPTVYPVGDMFGDRPVAYVSSISEVSLLVLAVKLPGHAWHSLLWQGADEGALRGPMRPEAARACAEDLAEMFGVEAVPGPDGSPMPAADALTAALVAFRGGQSALIDLLDSLLPLPELRERVDRRVCIGPSGPALAYPAMLTGPVEAAHYAEYILIARSLSPDPTIQSLLGPVWSRAIDPRFDVLELLATEDSRAVKLLHRDDPRGFALWRPRWLMAPEPPEDIYDEFLVELDRCCPWPWDREAMAELLRTPDHPAPFTAFAEITGVPVAEPYLWSDDWTALDPDLLRFEPAGRFRLAAARMAAAVGSKVPLGPWSRIKLEGRGPNRF